MNMMSCEKVKKLKVLLVDEDVGFTDDVANFLEKSNLNCVVSNDSSVGILMMLEHEFDIVVLDFDILESLGDEVVEFLAIVRRLNHQKLVLTTRGSPSKELTMNMLKNGVDSFVSKPLKMEILYDIIKEQKKSSKPRNALFF